MTRNNLSWLSTLCILLTTVIMFSSCLVSNHATVPGLQNYTQGKDYTVKSISVPGLLSRPVLKHALKKENASPEVRRIAKRLRKTKVLLINTNDPALVKDLKEAYLLL